MINPVPQLHQVLVLLVSLGDGLPELLLQLGHLLIPPLSRGEVLPLVIGVVAASLLAVRNVS